MMHIDRLIKVLKSAPTSHMAGPNKFDANLFSVSHSCTKGKATSGKD